jgi:hypothetical protein
MVCVFVEVYRTPDDLLGFRQIFVADLSEDDISMVRWIDLGSDFYVPNLTTASAASSCFSSRLSGPVRVHGRKTLGSPVVVRRHGFHLQAQLEQEIAAWEPRLAEKS